MHFRSLRRWVTINFSFGCTPSVPKVDSDLRIETGARLCPCWRGCVVMRSGTNARGDYGLVFKYIYALITSSDADHAAVLEVRVEINVTAVNIGCSCCGCIGFVAVNHVEDINVYWQNCALRCLDHLGPIRSVLSSSSVTSSGKSLPLTKSLTGLTSSFKGI